MVKKLIKHEFIAYLRSLLIAQIVVVALGVVNRLTQFLETDHFIYDLIFGSTVIALAVASVVCIVMTTIFNIVRFYKNLYTCEGYLSFTLPVTPSQHIFAKLSTAVLFNVFTAVAVLLSVTIATSGDMLVEIVKAIAYLFDKLVELIGVNAWLFVIEFLVILLLAVIQETLLCYGCVTVGQTARKNRIFAAIGAYFIYYFATQIIGTFIAIIIVLLETRGIFTELAMILENHVVETLHVIFTSSMFISALLSFVYFLVIHRIMHKKLNLE